MVSKRAGVGVVGVGRWGKNLIRAFDGIDRSEVVAICDIDVGRLDDPTLQSRARRCKDLRDVLSDPGVDAVVIATPAATHATHAIRALEAGKHVFVEKPMALSLHDARRVREAALRTGRRLMVGHLLCYHPAVVELERLIAAGTFGVVQHIIALRLGPKGSSNDEGPWWSLAPHDVSLVRRLLRTEIVAVSAQRRSFPDGASTIDARLSLRAGSAWLVASTASPDKIRRLLLSGDRATAIFDDGGPKPSLVVARAAREMDLVRACVGSRDAERAVAVGDALSRAGASVALRDEQPLRREAAQFIAAILDGGRIVTDADEGCSVTAALEAGNLSMSAGGRTKRVASPSVRTSQPSVAEEQPG